MKMRKNYVVILHILCLYVCFNQLEAKDLAR